MRAVVLCLVLAGCAQPRIKVVCPPLHSWTVEFQKNMAAETRIHREDCPNLIEGIRQMVDLRIRCNVR